MNNSNFIKKARRRYKSEPKEDTNEEIFDEIELRKLENEIRKASEIDETYAEVPVHVAKAMLKIVRNIGDINKDLAAINHAYRIVGASKQKSHRSAVLNYLENECEELRDKIKNLVTFYPNALQHHPLDQTRRLASILKIYNAIYDV